MFGIAQWFSMIIDFQVFVEDYTPVLRSAPTELK